jgi:hypothetical protein
MVPFDPCFQSMFSFSSVKLSSKVENTSYLTPWPVWFTCLWDFHLTTGLLEQGLPGIRVIIIVPLSGNELPLGMFILCLSPHPSGLSSNVTSSEKPFCTTCLKHTHPSSIISYVWELLQMSGSVKPSDGNSSREYLTARTQVTP